MFAHSIGATCALGAAASGAPVRRLALYEPPGRQTAPKEWRERVTALIADGKPGPAMVSFLREMGLSATEIDELRNAPRGYDVLPIVSGTMPREALALATVDVTALAAAVTVPVLLLLGSRNPAWAHDITGALADVLPQSTLPAWTARVTKPSTQLPACSKAGWSPSSATERPCPRDAAASSPGGRSDTCSHSDTARGSPGARARPPRTARPPSPR